MSLTPSIQSTLQRYQPEILASLQSTIKRAQASSALQEVSNLAPFYGQMQYHLGWVDSNFSPVSSNPGKQLRPILLLLAFEATAEHTHDAETEQHDSSHLRRALPAAASIELTHNFTLIHDDIEDGDQTAIIQSIGTARVVNVASALLILAHKVLLSLLDEAVDRSLILSLLNTLVNASLKSANGQHLDILFENREFADISGEESINMIGLKSGSLMSATMHLGALCAGAEKGICEKFAECGRLLGIAYQLDNDSHDLYNIVQSLDNAENAYCHKTIKTDLTLEKKTLPIIIANKYENILHVNEPDRKALKEGILVSWAVSLLYRERALECLQELEKRSLVSPLLRLVL